MGAPSKAVKLRRGPLERRVRRSTNSTIFEFDAKCAVGHRCRNAIDAAAPVEGKRSLNECVTKGGDDRSTRAGAIGIGSIVVLILAIRSTEWHRVHGTVRARDRPKRLTIDGCRHHLAGGRRTAIGSNRICIAPAGEEHDDAHRCRAEPHRRAPPPTLKLQHRALGYLRATRRLAKVYSSVVFHWATCLSSPTRATSCRSCRT